MKVAIVAIISSLFLMYFTYYHDDSHLDDVRLDDVRKKSSLNKEMIYIDTYTHDLLESFQELIHDDSDNIPKGKTSSQRDDENLWRLLDQMDNGVIVFAWHHDISPEFCELRVRLGFCGEYIYEKVGVHNFLMSGDWRNFNNAFNQCKFSIERIHDSCFTSSSKTARVKYNFNSACKYRNNISGNLKFAFVFNKDSNKLKLADLEINYWS